MANLTRAQLSTLFGGQDALARYDGLPTSHPQVWEAFVQGAVEMLKVGTAFRTLSQRILNLADRVQHARRERERLVGETRKAIIGELCSKIDVILDQSEGVPVSRVLESIENVASDLETLFHRFSPELVEVPQEAPEDEDEVMKKQEKSIKQFRSLEETTTKAFEKVEELLHPPSSDLSSSSSSSDSAPRVFLPWRLRYCVDADPFERQAMVEFRGGSIEDAEGKNIWEDQCAFCFHKIQDGALFGVGSPRFRCTDVDAIACHDCHLLLSRLSARINGLETPDQRDKNRKKRVLYQVNPLHDFRFAQEVDHPVFKKLLCLQAPNIALLFNNIFLTNHSRRFASNIDSSGRLYDFVHSSSPSFSSALHAFHHRLLLQSYGKNPEEEAESHPSESSEDAQHKWISYGETRFLAIRLAQIVQDKTHLKAGDRVGICSRNSIEWYLSDFACVLNRYTSVGLHTNQSESEFGFVSRFVELQLLFASHDMFLKYILPLLHSDPSSLDQLKTVILLDVDAVSEEDQNQCPNLKIHSLIDLLQQSCGEEIKTGSISLNESNMPTLSRIECQTPVFSTSLKDSLFSISSPDYHRSEQEPDEQARLEDLLQEDGEDRIFTLIFTSGSTGNPKGCVMKTKLWINDIQSPTSVCPNVFPSYMPSSLASDRTSIWTTLYNGGSVGFIGRSVDLFQQLRSFHPNMISLPPAIATTIFQEFLSVKHAALSRLVSSGDSSSELTAFQKMEIEERAEEIARSHIQLLLSQRLMMLVVGGASVGEKLLQFVQKTFSFARIDEGYGATE